MFGRGEPWLGRSVNAGSWPGASAPPSRSRRYPDKERFRQGLAGKLIASTAPPEDNNGE